MIPAGYMAKVVADRPDWINAPNVVRIHSVSRCVSADFCDYIDHWQHNGYWFFDTPTPIRAIAQSDPSAAQAFEIFYYELDELQYDDERSRWEGYGPEESFPTNVQVPERKELLGFDVVTYSAGTSPECSPLSCNNLAETIEVNESCLLRSLEEAKRLVEGGAFSGSEPGPFRIVAVYRPVA